MKIVLRPHLKIRLKERQIPSTYPGSIINQPELKFSDNLTKHLITIKRLMYNNKLRMMVAVYDIIDQQIQVITIYPTTKQEIENRVKSKRWIKDEKN